MTTMGGILEGWTPRMAVREVMETNYALQEELSDEEIEENGLRIEPSYSR